MKWLLCKQDSYNNISYITDDMSMPENMDYKDFLSYIRPYIIEKWEEFDKELNSFKVIVIEYPEGSWTVREDKRTCKDFTKDELYALNQNTNKKEKTTLEKVLDEKVDKARRFLQRFARNKR